MGSRELLSVSLVKEIIKSNFNRYFKCADIVDFVIAVQNGVSLKLLMDCKKRCYNPYESGRINLCGKVTWVLKGSKKDGYIEKYNKKTWRVVK